jgi:hypothetical protein
MLVRRVVVLFLFLSITVSMVLPSEVNVAGGAQSNVLSLNQSGIVESAKAKSLAFDGSSQGLLFSSNFADLNGWMVIDGTWTVMYNVLQGTTQSGQEGLIWAGDTAWTNYKVIASACKLSGNDLSLVVRYTGPDNFYWLGLGAWGHRYSISKVVNGVYTELASSGFASEVEVGRWYMVSAVVIDSTLQLFVDGVKVLEVQDSSHPSGAVGFRTWDGSMQANQLTVQSMGWSKTYGGTYSDWVTSMVQTSDGGYAMAGYWSVVTGYTSGYFWLVKTDSVGHLQWNKTYGIGSDASLVQTSDGGYAIAGTKYSNGADFWLVKTDSSGNKLWDKTYGEERLDSARFVIQTSDGGYALAGYTVPANTANSDFRLVKTDSAGNQQWSKTFGGGGIDDAYSVVQASDGGYAIAGWTLPYGGAKGDFLLVKVDSAGNQQWSKTYGGTGDDNPYSMIRTSDGGYAILGSTDSGTNNNDFLLVKVDSAGNQQWSKTYGGTGGEYGYSLVQTSDGGYVLAGITYSYGAGYTDFWLVKTDSSGNELWDKAYGGTDADHPYSVVQTSDGGYAIAGSTYSSPADAKLVKVPVDAYPITVHNYNGLWRTADFTITLQAMDDFTSLSQIYYRINDGSTRTVNSNGQPVINTQGANNKLEYWSADNLGHEELPHNVLNGIKLDKTVPTGSIIVNGGDASTSSTSVTLTLTANDLTSGVSQVRYSNDGFWDTENWETPALTRAWTLTSGAGLRTVYCQIKNNAGLVSNMFSDDITLTSTFDLKGLKSWYWTSNTGINSVASGDVDNDGSKEIVTGGYYVDGTRNVAQLIIWSGSTMSVKHIQCWYWTSNTVINSVALGDVDGDGQVEIVTGGSFFDGTRNIAQLVVWSGSDLSVERIQCWYWTGNTVINSVALGDIDGDGQIEIFTGGYFNDGTRNVAQMIVWSGSNLAVERIQCWYWTGNTVINSVALGDIDADGQVEIVTGGSFFDGTRNVAQLIAWTGSTLTVDKIQCWYWTGNTVINSLAIGNVDGDGQVEVVTGGLFNDGSRDVAQLVVWAGSDLLVERIQCWYWTDNTVINSVALGDVDGDGQTEVVSAGRFNDGTRDVAQLIVWSGSNLLVENIQSWYWTGNTSINSLVIGDLDSDFLNEIVTGGSFYDGTRSNSQLTVWGMT